MKPSRHILALVLLPLALLAAAFSYYRFMVASAYIVQFEGACDPESESCFIGCEDDECTDVYYYSHIQRQAAAVRELCGPDITECATAASCAADEAGCSIEFCDPETDDCAGPNEPADAAEEIEDEQASEETA